ncbi:hypothetical protein NSK_000595 [Nannochloropsis salina CCMP1776]|uniref:Uncharacterized protein n=1 Tax=Nannochloropsis salina CCMP1776 TaxID=1027361 RepID=A0A4D9DF35_9STRA|nr:hypothetical protein NSK_000595 [Nannochloropsis salina CCMP1776]|eukprot:TFJ88245.1 hypothetical protein NSK_000595 [Nannochloropsis salina CCMP1776]
MGGGTFLRCHVPAVTLAVSLLLQIEAFPLSTARAGSVFKGPRLRLKRLLVSGAPVAAPVTATAASVAPDLEFGKSGIEEGDVDVEWFEALQAYGRDSRPSDPLLKLLAGVSSWRQFETRVENEWVTDRVECEEDRDRLKMKLGDFMDALQEYVHAHTLFTQVLSPTANGCDGMFLERVRFEAFESAQSTIRRKQEGYLAAHVRFWADLAAVLRSQEDIPQGGVAQLDQAIALPAPYGQGDSGIVSLPPPSLFPWALDEVGGGVEDQVGAVLLLKAAVLPALETAKRERSEESFSRYAKLWGRLWRKAGTWFGADTESSAFLEELYRSTGGRVAMNDDPSRTGLSLAGVGPVERRGMEDAWLQE